MYGEKEEGMAGTHIDNAALFAVLSSLADNKQAIGRRYAYWCNGAPALEAAVAAAAMTQDETWACPHALSIAGRLYPGRVRSQPGRPDDSHITVSS